MTSGCARETAPERGYGSPYDRYVDYDPEDGFVGGWGDGKGLTWCQNTSGDGHGRLCANSRDCSGGNPISFTSSVEPGAIWLRPIFDRR